jgi:UDP-2-acetamido-3-amino-2,3-dideoxy-glucuronate N-acetyltransferase
MTHSSYIPAMEVIAYKFDVHQDVRGTLMVQELESFPVKFTRLFTLKGASDGAVRGGHAHKICWLFMYSSGKDIQLKIENIMGHKTFYLEPELGILIPPYNWSEIIFSNSNSVLNVLASEPYNPDDYIYERP